jgi:long-chain acyl-CoA synthetase
VNVADLLLSAGDDSATALVDHGGAVTRYRELRETVAKVASWLETRDVAVGDRVLLVAENTLFFVAAYLGTMKAGAVVVPVAPHASAEEIAQVVESAEPTVAFVQRKVWDRLPESFTTIRVAVVDASPEKVSRGATSFESLLLESTGKPRADRIADADQLAALMFTSGSTGKPRGVMLSHANIAANTRAIAEYLGLGSSDRVMAVLPMHYCYGASLLHTHLLVGGSVVIDNRFMFADKVLKRMIDLECTGFAGVPSHFQILLRSSSMKSMSFPKLRTVQQAGGKLADPLIRELVETLPHARIFVMYGQTEATARLSYLPPEELSAKLGSIGKGIPGVVLHVLDEDGAPVKGDAVGEIVAEGPSIARGYWRDEAGTAATFENGRLRTGDLARRDADGNIFIVDRAKDFLKCGGTRTSSLAIETVLFHVPEVVEAAVIAIPDDLLGEAPCAFVVVREGASESDVETLARAECTKRLAPELVPKMFRFEKSLPKTASGKLSKPALRALLGTPRS